MSFVGNAVRSVGNAVGSIFGGGGGGGGAPPAPDYTGAAQATAQGNLDAARAAAAANRVNQVTPYGNLTYTQSGTDPFGNPLWTATQTLSPDQQALYNYDIATSKGLGELSSTGLNYVRGMMQTPFGTQNISQMPINAGEQYEQAILRRAQPQLQQSRERLAQQLANQGIDIGSEAYDRAMMQQNQRENDFLQSAIVGGFNTGLASRQQGFQEQAYMRNEPLNTLNAVRSGAQVTGPQFVNVPQQATTAGADLLGAAGLQGQYNLGNYNAQQAANSAMTGGLFNLAGAAIMSPKGTFAGPTGLFSKIGGLFSDPRTKENIKAIGVMDNGLTLYSFEYKDEFKDHELAGHGVHVGVMADEVEQVFPYAVSTLDDGYKVVNYSLLP